MRQARSPEVRARLVERAAELLRTREPVTLRSVVDGTGVSTMAVYTHFGGMDGLWHAVRREGFARLSARIDELPVPDDPIEELAGMVAAYVANALQHPDLHRAMFDAGFDADDVAAAEETLGCLVGAAGRGVAAGRLAPDTDPREVATQAWTVAHGLASLVANGPLPPAAALDTAVRLIAAVATAAGDGPAGALASARAGLKPLEAQVAAG
jgi:AcrR family transcriptional regulator